MFHGETMQISDAAYASAMRSEPYHRNRLAMGLRLIKAHADLRDKSTFDFGCGEGTFMRMLAVEGAIVAGSDPSKTLIDVAPESAAVGSVETLERLPPNSIDILVALHVLGYVPQEQQSRFWPAARAALKPGGMMLQGNANPRMAAGKSYLFMADPRTFPRVLLSYGFEEIGRDFHRFRPDRYSRKIIGRDIVSRHVQGLIPMAIRARRSTGYFSLSQRSS